MLCASCSPSLLLWSLGGAGSFCGLLAELELRLEGCRYNALLSGHIAVMCLIGRCHSALQMSRAFRQSRLMSEQFWREATDSPKLPFAALLFTLAAPVCRKAMAAKPCLPVQAAWSFFPLACGEQCGEVIQVESRVHSSNS